MRLIVPIPPDWQKWTVAEGVLYQSPVPVLDMLVVPPDGAPADPEAWIGRALFYRAPQGHEAQNVRMSQLTTEDGWAMILCDADVATEARLVAYYPFMDYAGTVIVTCRDPAALPSWRQSALEILIRARPDFAMDGIVCLAHQLGSPPPTVSPAVPRDTFASWERSFAGSDVVFTSVDGPQAGRIRIVRRVAPLRSVEQIFGRFLEGAEPGAAVERPSVMVTAEGEYATFANAVGLKEQRSLGVVFGDDHYAQIIGASNDPALFERFRASVLKLTYALTMGLGSNRWRPFYYEPPPGWIGLARTRGALWMSPRVPRQYQVLKVFDARPESDHRAARHGARIFETLPVEFFRDPPSVPFVFYTPAGLQCRVMVFAGQVPNRRSPIRAVEGAVVDARYLYPLRMECDAELLEETMHAFEQVATSIRPIPDRSPDLDPDMNVVSSWVD